MVTKITKADYHALLGLKLLATELDTRLKFIQEAVAKIIGEDEQASPGSGWAGELTFSSISVDRVLFNADIEVENE